MDRALDQLVFGQVSQAEPLAGLEDDARRAHELRHDDALGAVDDEGALVGHLGEVPHEDRLLLDLTGVLVDERGPHEDRGRVRHVPFLALLDRELRPGAQVFVVRIEVELQVQGLGEVLDRRDVAERVREALIEEPLEGLSLDGDQVREGKRLVEVRERVTVPDGWTGGQRGLLEKRAGFHP